VQKNWKIASAAAKTFVQPGFFKSRIFVATKPSEGIRKLIPSVELSCCSSSYEFSVFPESF